MNTHPTHIQVGGWGLRPMVVPIGIGVVVVVVVVACVCFWCVGVFFWHCCVCGGSFFY